MLFRSRAPDNIWRAPDHICAHQKYMHTHIFSGARIYGARHLIYGARQIICGARQIIYARTRKYMRTHIFSGARIYIYIWRAPSNMWRAPDNIWRAPDHICAHQKIYAHASIFWCTYIYGARHLIYGACQIIYMARARSYMRAPENRCARIYFWCA